MLLPVWIADWEMGCCGPRLAAGDRWQPSLVIREVEGLRTEPSGTLPWQPNGVGLIEFVAVAEATSWGTGSAPVLLDLEVCRIGAPDLDLAKLPPNPVAGKGRVWAVWHSDWEDGHYDEIECSGYVRSVNDP